MSRFLTNFNDYLLIIFDSSNVSFDDYNFQTNYEDGELTLTSHRIIWARPGDIARGQVCLSLPLSRIFTVEDTSPSTFTFWKSRKIILHLAPVESGRLFLFIICEIFL